MKVLVLLLFPIFSYAELIVQAVQYPTNKEYFLSSNDCAELKTELQFFKTLSTTYANTAIQTDDEIDCKGNSITSLEKYLPTNIKMLLNAKNEFYGPNCWNSVIHANGLHYGIRFSSPVEFEKTLAFHRCQKRSVGEKIQPGDIIRLFKDNEDFHAFVFISPHFSFSKNGPQTNTIYDILSTTSILRFYSVDEHCLGNETQTVQAKCIDQVQVFNCHKNKAKKADPRLELLLTETENRMTYLLLNYRQFPSSVSREAFVNDLNQKLNTLFFIINNDLVNGKLDPETFRREDYYMSRVLSLKEQISYF